jgi:hypothetical protein
MASIVKVIQNNVEKIVTVDGQILQAPAGAGDSAIYNSPLATKGSVSSHSINITPSFTVTSAGNINTGTITGTPVTVQASELVSGTKSISSNGTNIDVTDYSMVDVNVPTSGGNIQTSKSYTVSNSGAQTINPDSGYDGMAEVNLSVPAGVATSASSITASSATISTGTNTITLSKSVSNTPRITTAGYISSGTAGNSSISLSASVTTKAAATITPGTTNQTISSGTYLTGMQTISGDANLIASNIKNGVPIFGVTGNYTGTGTGWTLLDYKDLTANVTSTDAIVLESFENISNFSWTSEKIFWVKIRDKAGPRNGYFTGSDAIYILHEPLEGTIHYTTKVIGYCYSKNSSGTIIKDSYNSTTTGYGVYPTLLYDSSKVGISGRYNSAHSFTINGTYRIEVYSLDYPPNQGNPFNYSAFN